ncbi:MAG: cytochrome c oxidase subunit 3 [Bacteroidia bacterium]|nr:cytochrome c oxidase subunit 3 [Bacteroidia bacterium]
MSSLGLEMDQKRYIIHPQKFALWLSIISLIMIFGGLTSAYSVQRSFIADPIIFDLPPSLWTNLGLILFSSVTMQFAVWSLKRNETQALVGLGMTLVLGIFFLIGQWGAWEEMVDSGLYFVDKERQDNSVSFFYIFTGLHGAHIIAGLVALFVIMFRTLITPHWDKLQFTLSKKARLAFILVAFLATEYYIVSQIFEFDVAEWANQMWLVEGSEVAVTKGAEEATGMGWGVRILWLLAGPLAAYFLFLTAKFFVKPYKSLEAKVLDYQMTSIFWHFLDLLWIYLFLFLLITQNPA